jgi:glycosyltransferase involved in cell wall biosynthesis
VEPFGISIIIPTFNRVALAPRAVASALREAGPDDEVIVVDDGSTDDTRAALAPFLARIRLIAAAHAGAGAARNRGIAEARNPWVAFLDSDDEWLAGHLSLHRRLHQARPDLVFSFSNFSVQDRQQTRPRFLQHWQAHPKPWTKLIGPNVPFGKLVAEDGPDGEADVYIGDVYLSEMIADIIPTFTLVARRDALPDAEWFAPDVPVFEDWQAFGRLAARGLCGFIDRDTAIQHGHAHGRLTDLHELRKLAARLKLLRRVWGGDPQFVHAHQREYRSFQRTTQLALAKCLLTMGHMREARQELRQIEKTPLTYRVFASLPSPLARSVVRTWRTLRGRRVDDREALSA